MAQKKVILKDGSDDLLPKTLASMVFTEAGQTVEAALQSAGGGSSSGGGTGNVNVTNGSSLQKDAYYAFQPSAAGSLTGKFATIPTASASASGLMSNADKSKLDSMKKVVALPASVAEYTADTPSATIEADLESAFGEGLAAINLIYIAASLSGDYNSGFPKVYIGNRECLLSGSVETDGGSPTGGTLELSYVTGGKLRTIAITLTISGSGSEQTYAYAAKVVESGDDMYILPKEIFSIKAGATEEYILEIFTTDLRTEIRDAVKSGKKLCFLYDDLGLVAHYIPVSYIGFTYTALSWVTVSTTKKPSIKYLYASGDGSYVQELYIHGYELSPSLYSLTTSSSSDDISTAVGGEAGLKAIIQAVKDGNRLVIRGAYSDQIPLTSSTEVISVGYNEGENGDMQLLLSYWVYIGIGMTHNILAINYTKSSNTFAVSASQDIS